MPCGTGWIRNLLGAAKHPPESMGRDYGRPEFLLLVLGGLSYTCYTFIWFTLPAFLSTLIAEFDLSTTEAGLLVGAVPIMYVPLGLVSGLLIDRIGSRAAIGAGLVVFGAVQIARGVATGFLTLLIPTLLLGVAGMAITFGLPKLVSELFPPERTGAMSSVYQIGAQLGPIAAFGLSRPLLEPFFGGWRPTFIASGLVVLAFALGWGGTALWYARRHKRPTPLHEETDDQRDFTLASARRDIRRLIAHRDMLLLVVIGTMHLFISHGLRGWLPVILEGTGLTAELAGIITSLLIVAQISGTITIPPLSDRWNRRKAALVVCGVLATVGTTGLLLGPTTLVAIVAVVWAAGMGLGGLSPMIKVIPIDMEGIGPALTATAVSFVYAVGEIGGFAGPFVIGALHDATGVFDIGIATLIAASLIIILASTAMTHVD